MLTAEQLKALKARAADARPAQETAAAREIWHVLLGFAERLVLALVCWGRGIEPKPTNRRATAARPVYVTVPLQDFDALVCEVERLQVELAAAEIDMDACEICGPRRLLEFEAAQPDPTLFGREFDYC